jgi:hypothetical protein
LVGPTFFITISLGSRDSIPWRFELQVSLPCLQSLFLEAGPEKHYLLGIKFSKPEIWLAFGPHELLVKRKLGFKFFQPLCTYELVAQAFMKTS